MVIEHSAVKIEPHWPEEYSHFWLRVDHVCSDVLFIPIVKSHYMQEWQTVSAAWLQETIKGMVYQVGFESWLTTISHYLSVGKKAYFDDYIKEALCAVEHRELCKQAYHDRLDVLKAPICDLKNWYSQLLFSDQIAAYLDHPYYPTAHAKFGFNKQALIAYSLNF